MELTFTKMHGLGNDFVLIDSRDMDLSSRFTMTELAKRLCDRRFGVGADQLLLLLNSNAADFKMKIFNADGSEVEMCGNGIRCLAKYVWDKGLSNKDTLKIDTLAGIIRPQRVGELVRVDMGEPLLEAEKIPVNIKAAAPIVDYPLKVNDREFRITCISMGNPHAVVFLNENIADFPVTVYGPAIESHPLFPNKTNVEFVNVINRRELTMRVWERGAGETLACGTGASAVGAAAMVKGLTERRVTIHLRGGDLAIEWPEHDHIYMTGPATEVFEGRIANLEEKKTENRRHPRRACQTALEFVKKSEPKGATYSCICLDISESGIGIITDSELKPGEIIVFKKKDNPSMLKGAVVIWSNKTEGKYRSGLMFI